MAKKALQERAHLNRQGAMMERNTIEDDNLLPAAEELQRLKELDPNIIEWVKERVALEQDARIRFNDNRVGLAKKDMVYTQVQNMTALIFSFLIILGGMGFSTFLITRELTVEGTVFAGSTIILSAISFLKYGKKNKVNTK
jgi:uncharacterized membrane protein